MISPTRRRGAGLKAQQSVPNNDRSSSMTTPKPAQQGGSQSPAPQQQGQSGGSTQQQGGTVFRDWASI